MAKGRRILPTLDLSNAPLAKAPTPGLCELAIGHAFIFLVFFGTAAIAYEGYENSHKALTAIKKLSYIPWTIWLFCSLISCLIGIAWVLVFLPNIVLQMQLALLGQKGTAKLVRIFSCYQNSDEREYALNGAEEIEPVIVVEYKYWHSSGNPSTDSQREGTEISVKQIVDRKTIDRLSSRLGMKFKTLATSPLTEDIYSEVKQNPEENFVMDGEYVDELDLFFPVRYIPNYPLKVTINLQ